MSKQTAVEWLVEQLTPAVSLQQKYIDEIKAKAKAMENEQIIEAISKGWDYYEDGKVRWMGEQYYNETYGGERSDEIGSSLNWNGEVTQGINHIVDTNEMIDHIGNVTKMVDYVSNVEKLAEEEYPIFDGDLLEIAHNQQHSRIDFIKGYNKAKETLFTEEQVKKAYEYGSNASLGVSKTNLIQSLKQGGDK